MTERLNKTVSLFDTYCLVVPKGLTCSQDGKQDLYCRSWNNPGLRLLALTAWLQTI